MNFCSQPEDIRKRKETQVHYTKKTMSKEARLRIEARKCRSNIAQG